MKPLAGQHPEIRPGCKELRFKYAALLPYHQAADPGDETHPGTVFGFACSQNHRKTRVGGDAQRSSPAYGSIQNSRNSNPTSESSVPLLLEFWQLRDVPAVLCHAHTSFNQYYRTMKTMSVISPSVMLVFPSQNVERSHFFLKMFSYTTYMAFPSLPT